MGNRYFSQYLLNVGVLSADNVGYILPKSAHATPQLALLAVQQGLLTEAQVAELEKCSDIEAAMADKQIISAVELENLKNTVPGRDVCIAQVLLDEKISTLSELAKLFRACDSEDVHPVKDAVSKRIGAIDDMETVVDFYGEYTELFVGALQRFMNTDAVVLSEESDVSVDGSWLVSQRMGGQMSLTAGVMALKDVFLEMANRYSGEQLTEVDDMAVDCVAEFINVLNGLYIVNMSGQDLDMDLEMPKTAENVEPSATNIVALRVVADFGTFVLYLAQDEFVC